MENLTLMNVQEAQANIGSYIQRTPLDHSQTYSKMTNSEIYLKLENMQKTGSFKVRGAANKISKLTSLEKKYGVIASSAGNHAQGVALAASRGGIPATIVMPESAPIAKIDATRGYGANVILYGNVYDDAYEKAKEIQAVTGATFIHPFDDLDVMAGQGTIGLEILEDLPDVDTVLVPVGGGGLISGIAVAIKSLRPKVRVIGIQAAEAASMSEALRSGHPILIDTANTLADGIAVKRAGDLTFDHIKQWVDDIVTVTEDEISAAILSLMERAKSIAEGAGSVALAAALNAKVDITKQKTVLVISGGNIDVNFLAQIIERGLLTNGRSMVFRTILPDRPGNLEKLLILIAKERANVLTVEQVRYDLSVPLRYARVTMTLETLNYEHQEKVLQSIREAGYPFQKDIRH
ncbi:threonine ammonia-lyase [Desulfosporosinus fructosivorans]|uniref:threonine ammonia-lyase n=1 Tax=Desulfosporosinus fructosivorans TaxID=2018669 RepID=A0A4Z0R5M7_9FIRM|nr:threonine ammonia-lyase [Desulfosporosinus fructosivorans]TGE36946.1 threonine ammonia-lyase [Desulfosporosinus fructosivorans]